MGPVAGVLIFDGGSGGEDAHSRAAIRSSASSQVAGWSAPPRRISGGVIRSCAYCRLRN